MSRSVRLAPVSRIEGHGRVTLHLGDDGRVADAHFDALEFRGFERFLEGRMAWEMPLMTSRVCGICPVSHHIAAIKAVEDMLGVEPPRPGRLLRELLHLAGFVHDHALHFFFLAGPDFLTGDGASRDLLGVVAARPDLARRAVALRRAGQEVVSAVGGQGHPVTAIPGGMSRGIGLETRDELRELTLGALGDALEAERLAKECTLRLLEEHPGFADTSTAYMGLGGPDGAFGLYDGPVAVIDGTGTRSEFPASAWRDAIGERVVEHSYAKVPYLESAGAEDGVYRVGALARLNLATGFPGEHAPGLASEFRDALGHPAHAALAYHWARMIELVAVIERMTELLGDDEIVSDAVRVKVERGGGIGASAVEAPRGTLFHRYEADDMGRVTRADLVVATTNNNAAIDAAVKHAVAGASFEDSLDDATMLRMELGIRAYDPCLSCATHEIGRLPLAVEVRDAGGRCLYRRGVA